MLLDLRQADVTGPLAQFQAADGVDRDEMLKLAGSLNEVCTTPLDTSRLGRAFDRCWDDYYGKVPAVRASSDAEPITTQRSETDILTEILERVHDLQRPFESQIENSRFRAAPSSSFPELTPQQTQLLLPGRHGLEQ